VIRRAAFVALGGLSACTTPAPEPRASPAAAPAPAARPAIPRAPGETAAAPAACAPAEHLPAVDQPTHEMPARPSEANLRSWVETLAGTGLRGREAGTADALRAARSIAERFSALGIDRPDPSGYCRPFSDADLRDHNVVAHMPPREDRCRWVVLGAHYDALGVDRRGRIFPGADDNASGVSLLLEAARLLAGERRPDVGVVFAAFGAEEKDLSGSRAYVQGPTLPLDRVALMINVDMVGKRPAGHPGIGYQPFGRESERTDRLVKRAAGRAAVGVIPMRLGDRSDSASFAPHVPTVFFSTAVSAEYHQPTDTPDRVDYGQVRRALQVVLELVESVGCEG
jgi:hypothetical protein